MCQSAGEGLVRLGGFNTSVERRPANPPRTLWRAAKGSRVFETGCCGRNGQNPWTGPAKSPGCAWVQGLGVAMRTVQQQPEEHGPQLRQATGHLTAATSYAFCAQQENRHSRATLVQHAPPKHSIPNLDPLAKDQTTCLRHLPHWYDFTAPCCSPFTQQQLLGSQSCAPQRPQRLRHQPSQRCPSRPSAGPWAASC